MPRRITVTVTIFILTPLFLTLPSLPTNAETQTTYRWTSLPLMPTPRTEVTSAAIGNDVYVIGGFEEEQVISNRVEIFNFTSRNWRSGPPLAVPLHHTVVVSLNGEIYALGGYSDGWIPVNTVYIYNPSVGDWREGPRMLQAKAAFTAQVVDGKIYTMGGVTVLDVGGRLIQEVLDANEYYDPETLAWAKASPMPSPREHLASAQIGGKIYTIGGRSLTLESNTDITEEYDPQADTWVRKAPMPTKRGGIAASSFGGKLIVFGGESSEGTFDAAEAYDSLKDIWVKINRMPTARHGLAAVAINGGIMVVGGGVDPGFSYSDKNEFLEPIEDALILHEADSIVGLDSSIWLWVVAVLSVLAVSSIALYFLIRRR
jgi:N-acetylneuraminic acid mutarotase